MRVSFHPAALDELRSGAEWYEASRVGLGADFTEAVEQVVAEIAAAAERWPSWPQEPRARRRLLHRFPFAVFYAVLNEVVFVVAVAHSNREPGYWKRRLGDPEP